MRGRDEDSGLNVSVTSSTNLGRREGRGGGGEGTYLDVVITELERGGGKESG